MSAEKTDRLLREAQELAHITAAHKTTVASVNREVTVTVGPGGVPRKLELSPAARRLGPRVLSRLIVDTVREARALTQSELRSRFGDRSSALWFATAEGAKSTGEDAEPAEAGANLTAEPSAENADPTEIGEEPPELSRLREAAMAGIATGLQLQRESAATTMTVESPDGRLRLLLRGGELERLSIEDDLLDDERLGERILESHRTAMARFAEQGAERAAELGALDVRAMVAACAPKER